MPDAAPEAESDAVAMATLAPQHVRGTRSTSAGRDVATQWGLAAGLAVVAVGLAAIALLGPLVSEIVDHRVTGTLRNQTLGLDAVSLLVVAPLALLAAVLVVRGHVLGRALALGIGAYASYMIAQYVLGPDYTGLPGNNERLFPLYLVVFAAGWMLAVAAWSTIDAGRLPRSQRRDLLVGRLLLPALGFLAFVRYLPAVADAMSSTPEGAGYLAGPSFFWVIALLDLGLFLPLTVATCVGLVRNVPWAQKLLYAVAGWFGLVGAAVAAMAIALYVNDDPTATAGGTVFMTALGLAFAALAVYVYLPLLERGPSERTVEAEP